jgi:hypothetical protein
MTPTSRRGRRRAARRTGGVVAGTLVIIAAGCTSAPSEPGVTPTSASRSAGALQSSRPPVPRPLDASAHRDQPCTLFTDEQARVLGYLEPGSPAVRADVASCAWRGDVSGDSDLWVDYYAATDLLGQIYRRETTSWPSNSTVQVTIAGQPALKTALPTAELCKVALGLTDSQAVEIRVADKHVDSCDRAVRIAETVVHNLGG